jgi:hypothetical protein
VHARAVNDATMPTAIVDVLLAGILYASLRRKQQPLALVPPCISHTARRCPVAAPHEGTRDEAGRDPDSDH